MAYHIKNLAQLICQRLDEQCCDDDITSSSREEKSRLVDWELFLEDLSKVEDLGQRRAMVEQPIERGVQVKKNEKKEDLRAYEIRDSILQKALRRSPPPNVIKELVVLSPIYNLSKKLYDLISAISLEDGDWTEIQKLLHRITVRKEHGLTDTEIENVFRLRHGWKEDTLLMITSRRNPPLKVVKDMLNVCRESIATVNTPLYDRIPMIYAFGHGAKPEVMKELIPTVEDLYLISPLQENNFLEKLDVFNMTPIHWAILYGVSLEVINTLIERASSELLEQDYNGMKLFEYAISQGASIEIVEALLPNSIPDIETVESNIIRSFLTKKKSSLVEVSQNGEIDDFQDHDTNAVKRAQEKEDECVDVKIYEVSKEWNLYLSKQIARKKNLQNLLTKNSCQTLPMFIFMMDIYTCIILVISFRESSVHYLFREEPSASSLAWVTILLIVALYMTFRRLCEIFFEGMGCFLNLWNYIDVATITLVVWCGIRMLRNDVGSNFPTLVIWTTAFVWTNVVFFLKRTFLSFAILVSGLIRIFHDLIPFLILSVILMVAFGELYMVDSINNGECASQERSGGPYPFCTLQDGLYSTYTLYVSGIDMQDFDSTTNKKIISIVFGFLVTIILLNVIIAIVCNTWSSVAEEGKRVFWIHKLEYAQGIANVEQLIPCYKEGETQYTSSFTGSIDKRLEKLFLFLWPRSEYWGKFDSIFDRMFSSKPFSLSWQYKYEYKEQKSTTQRFILNAKVAMLVIVSTIIFSGWFVIGTATFGILWPPSIRRLIIRLTILSGETEEIKYDANAVLNQSLVEKKRADASNREGFNDAEMRNDNTDLLSLATGSIL